MDRRTAILSFLGLSAAPAGITMRVVREYDIPAPPPPELALNFVSPACPRCNAAVMFVRPAYKDDGPNTLTPVECGMCGWHGWTLRAR